ncbi:MAG: glycosyltransferase family 4 protein [Flavobacteriales bacterium]|nr:glycosyltransferase family 4 protein [Flavobacteriales bacterium]
MTKVCHITSVHQAKDIRIFHKQCSSLAQAGYDVSLVCANAVSEEVNGVHIIGVKSKVNSRVARALSTVNQVYARAVDVDADIYHLHDPELLRIAVKLKKRGKRVIYDVHEDLPRQIMSKHWIPKVLRTTASSLAEKYEDSICGQLDAVACATRYIAKRFEPINKNTLTINNYPLDHEIWSGNETQNKENAVCYIGGVSQIRGVGHLIDALSINADVKLNLAGPWSPVTFKSEMQATEGWQHVNNLGTVSREVVGQIMARSIAGLVIFLPEPNHINAQPNKMFEYMSAGLPVIGSDFPLWREIIEGNQCGLCIDPTDPQAIADAIQYITTHPDEALNMGRNGRKAVIEKYNWNKEAVKLMSMYENI